MPRIFAVRRKEIERGKFMDFEGLIQRYMSCSDLSEKQIIAAEFIRKLKGYKTVIYGAGATGMTLLDSMRANGMEPLFFVDRRYQECSSMEGVTLRPPEALIEVNTVDTVVIMAINAELIREFNQEPFDNIQAYSPSAVVIHMGIHVNSILRFAHCYQKLERKEDFNIVECLDCGAEMKWCGICGIYQKHLQRIAPGRKTLAKHPSRKFDLFGYIMGQYCDLRCKDCCEYVPYMKNPAFSDYRTILSDCSKIAASCEFLRYIELIGGEPLLHPQFREVLEGLLKIENVGYIRIFTNGTIVPKDDVWELLKNPRVVVNLSNYTSQAQGKQLENIHQTMKELKKRGIRYIYSESKAWLSYGEDFRDRGQEDKMVEDRVSQCFCFHCHRVFQGKLYRCIRQYAGIQLGQLERIEGEYVDINAWDPDTLARKLDEFEELSFIDACRRCDMPFDCPVVPAAIQLS